MQDFFLWMTKGIEKMIELKSMAVMMPDVAGHPNRTAFQGVLTTVDVPSQRPPSGARGHLVVLTKKAAEAALPSLLGMGVDYSPSLDRHDVRRKVGVITRAEIVGRNLELGGYLFARDFPEIVEEIAKSGRGDRRRLIECSRDRPAPPLTLDAALEESKETALVPRSGLKPSLRAAANQLLRLTETLGRKTIERKPDETASTIRAESQMVTASKGLGMSYEVTNVQLADMRATVWMLEKVTFTGAAILRREKAAYRETWIELE
jgi:hypothetical protein